MKIRVFRDCFGDGFALGEMAIDGEHFCYTCEDEDRHMEDDLSVKVKGLTAIPRGEYRAVLSMSNRFGKLLPEILGVPGFSGIRIHSGNTPADSDGCIIVGMARDCRNGSVHKSREAVGLLIERMRAAQDIGDKIYIEVA